MPTPPTDRSRTGPGESTSPRAGAPAPAQAGEPADAELLRRYVRERDEAAFHALVERHLGMVFGVALRRTGDRQLAEEIAQNVFTAFARKAPGLREEVIIGGWLHRAATFEAAEAGRRRDRHQRAMRAYTETTQAEGEGVDPLADALPALDEAIAELPGRDRDALFLRFYGGLSFREVGRRLGKSEEASQKQVRRALQKLTGLLRRRGISVPATAASAGLAGVLCKSAPAGLAASVSRSALAAAPAAGTPLFSLFLIAMESTKNKCIVAAAFCLLLGSATFWAGRRAAAQFGSAPTLPLVVPPGTAPAGGAVIYALDAPPEEDPEARALRILDEAAALARKGGSSLDHFYELTRLLHRLNPADAATAMAFLASVRDDRKVLDALAPTVLGICALADGPAAIGAAYDLLEGNALANASHEVLGAWARVEPDGAYTWYREKARSGDTGVSMATYRWIPKKIFGAWVESDPAAALAALGGIDVEDEDGAILGVAEARDRSLDPAPILDAVAAFPGGVTKERLVSRLASRWAKEDPEAAAAWLDTVPQASPLSQLKAKMEVAEEWLRRDRRAVLQIGAWLLSGAPEEMRAELVELISREAARLEDEEAGAGGEQEEGPGR